MDRWKQYLFESFSHKELRHLTSRLKIFRFFRAVGGHANDYDSLDLAIPFNSQDHLLDLFKTLEIKSTLFREKPPQPVKGKSYHNGEMGKFPNVIPETKWIENPGHSQIFDIPVFVWCSNKQIRLSPGPVDYEVTEAKIANAELLEVKLRNLDLNYIDPPWDTKHYICPKYYPEYFK